MLIFVSAKSQKWQPGHFTDVKGITETGFIRPYPGGNGPIKNEGFIEYKQNEKDTPMKLSAGDLQSFVAGKDSFVVAHAPGNETWAKKDLDFVRVVVDEPLKIYATRGAGSGGGGSGIHVSPGFGLSTGGGYGTSYGGGLGISFGGGGGGKSSKMSYYYGSNTAGMQHVTNENFKDIMSEIMGDEPDVVVRIRNGNFRLNNMEKLVEFYKKIRETPSK
ncbi:hypothetical protein [Mucilaginibacter glaciei]|uniref:Uncharacterized protein n=1 Tax=Mucilaginibacter glaciei TaxID=2772109 RepID=A0A926NQ02_9SPHI|nr:hypothetical protein [Mucilaginibacter glaciei]MBD1391770.1 hypothetical protein [Mucilaginibacter glaciei]